MDEGAQSINFQLEKIIKSWDGMTSTVTVANNTVSYT